MSKKLYEIYLSDSSPKDMTELSLKTERKTKIIDPITGERTETTVMESRVILEIHKYLPVNRHLCGNPDCERIEKKPYPNGAVELIPHRFYYLPLNNESTVCPKCKKQGRLIEFQQFQRREVFIKTDAEMREIIKAIKENPSPEDIIIKRYSEKSEIKAIAKQVKEETKPKPEKPDKPPQKPSEPEKTTEKSVNP